MIDAEAMDETDTEVLRRDAPGLITTGMLGMALQVWWFPLAVVFFLNPLPMRPESLGCLCAFFLAGGISVIAAHLMSHGTNTNTNRRASLHGWCIAAEVAGCTLVTLAGLFPMVAVALDVAGTAMCGCAMGVSGQLWSDELTSRRPLFTAIGVVALVMLTGITVAVLAVSPAPRECSWIGMVGCMSMMLMPSRGHASPRVYDAGFCPSHLLDVVASSLIRRYAVAFGVAFASSVFVLSQFLIGGFGDARVAIVAGSAGGSLVAGILTLAAWLPRREVDPFRAFKLSFPIAAISLFPFDAGTEFSLWMAVGFSCVWLACLICSLVGIGTHISRALTAWNDTSWIWPATAMLGAGGGAGLYLIYSNLLFMVAIDPARPSAVTNLIVCAEGFLFMIVLFSITNITVSEERVYRVELIAKGKFVRVVSGEKPSGRKDLIQTSAGLGSFSSMGGGKAGSTRVYASAGVGSGMDALCSRIALDCGLTPRELDVLSILAQGSTLQRVQDDLVISEGTASTHRKNIYHKLGVHSRQELIDFVSSYQGKMPA